MRILGVDCGSRVTGYGVIESAPGRLQAVGHGAIRIPAGRSLAERLRLVAEGLERVVERYGPAEAAFEEVFTAKNPRTALVLAHVRGAAMLSVARAGLPVASYSPTQVKASITGHGGAPKKQVRRMVRLVMGIEGDVRPLDASDALAVAYCHSTRGGSVA
ncbi:MAG: crossover junction endodeoxyribonuclease RuvC [Bryobacterales bacterium]|nr:crossover junction endodeoxyribonuclease RuvC [Bryobacterales bacterium]